WSYGLLARDEQALFRRLGGFNGGCQLDAAHQVAGPPDADEAGILNLLTSLVEKSMVTATTAADQSTRFGLLESVRDYAREQLAASGELDEVRDRHALTFLALGERAERETIGPDQAAWFA